MGDNDNTGRSRSHSRTPSINSSDFTINPHYYNMNLSDSSLLNTTSSSSESEQNSLQDNETSGFDAVEFLLKSINSSLSTLELDRSIVLQSQLSGMLNSKSKELLIKIQELQIFLKDYRAKITEYESKVIPSIVDDLNKSEKRVLKLNKNFKKNYPIEFQKSKDKIINRISNEDDDLYV